MEKFWYWSVCAIVVVACAYGIGRFINWLTDEFDMNPYDE